MKTPWKRAFFAAFARLVGIILGCAAGTWLQRAGGEVNNTVVAVILLIVSFGLMWFAEHERIS